MATPESLARLQQDLNAADILLSKIRKALLYEDDPQKRLKLEAELADTLRWIVQFQHLQAEVKSHPDLKMPALERSQGNPFNTLGIVGVRHFVGRKTKLEKIKKAVDDGNSVILIGPPRIGKSSFMRHIYEAYANEGWQAVFFDFMEPIPVREHYAALTRKLGATGNTYQEVKAAVLGRSVILFVDELESGPKRGFNAEQLGGFQSLARSDDNDTRFRVVAASTHPAKEIYPMTDRISLPYAFLRPEPLATFSPVECAALLQHYLADNALTFTAEMQAELIQISERHPFKLMRAACRLYDNLLDPEAEEDWKALYAFDLINMM